MLYWVFRQGSLETGLLQDMLTKFLASYKSTVKLK